MSSEVSDVWQDEVYMYACCEADGSNAMQVCLAMLMSWRVAVSGHSTLVNMRGWDWSVN